MERFSFSSEVAFVPPGDLLDRVTVAPLTSPFEEGSPMQAAIFRFAPGGRVLRHPTTFPEVFAVLEGSGDVRRADGVVEPIAAGEAVFWRKGEEQEMTSVAGLTVLIIQGEKLDRFRGRAVPLASRRSPRETVPNTRYVNRAAPLLIVLVLLPYGGYRHGQLLKLWK